MVDMNHLNFLEEIALNDVSEIKNKEQTYKGSWKKSGGRSAWFMLKRKIDRMIEMLKRPEEPNGFNIQNVYDTIDSLSRGHSLPGSPEATETILTHLINTYSSEDIFLKIESNPSGDDGSVLAEVRDLRRYLLLVESEMMSKGSIKPSTESNTK